MGSGPLLKLDVRDARCDLYDFVLSRQRKAENEGFHAGGGNDGHRCHGFHLLGQGGLLLS